MPDYEFKLNDIVCMATYAYPNSSLNKVGIIAEEIGFIREAKKYLYRVEFVYFEDFKNNKMSTECEHYYLYPEEMRLIKKAGE